MRSRAYGIYITFAMHWDQIRRFKALEAKRTEDIVTTSYPYGVGNSKIMVLVSGMNPLPHSVPTTD